MCIGTPTEIKRNYGSGLILNLIFDHQAGFNQESRPAVMEGLKEMFEYLCQEGVLKSYKLRGGDQGQDHSTNGSSDPEGTRLRGKHGASPAASVRTAQYEVEVDDTHVVDLFDYLEENKTQFMIGHYELAQSPLKDVFEKIVLAEQ